MQDNERSEGFHVPAMSGTGKQGPARHREDRNSEEFGAVWPLRFTGALPRACAPVDAIWPVGLIFSNGTSRSCKRVQLRRRPVCNNTDPADGGRGI